MRAIAYLLACLLCASHGREVQSTVEKTFDGAPGEKQQNTGRFLVSTELAENDGSPRLLRAGSDMWTTVCFWIVQILGTLMGLMFTLMAGCGKLCPCHPINGMMVGGFSKLFGPCFGVNGTLMRFFLGLTELIAGLGMLVALYYSPSSYEQRQLLQMLLLCDFVGMITISLGMSFAHCIVDGNPGPGLMFTPIFCVLLYCRLQVTPLWSFDSNNGLAADPVTLFPPATVFDKFIAVCVVGTLVAIVMRAACGKPAAELKEAKAAMEAAKE